MTSTQFEEPKSFREPQDVVTYMQRVLGQSATRAEELRPRISYQAPARDAARTGADYLIKAGNENYGGEQEVVVHLTPEEMASPGKTRIAFLSAYSNLLGKVFRALRREAYFSEPSE